MVSGERYDEHSGGTSSCMWGVAGVVGARSGVEGTADAHHARVVSAP